MWAWEWDRKSDVMLWRMRVSVLEFWATMVVCAWKIRFMNFFFLQHSLVVDCPKRRTLYRNAISPSLCEMFTVTKMGRMLENSFLMYSKIAPRSSVAPKSTRTWQLWALSVSQRCPKCVFAPHEIFPLVDPGKCRRTCLWRAMLKNLVRSCAIMRKIFLNCSLWWYQKLLR